MGELLSSPLPQERAFATNLIVNFFDGGPNTLVEYRIGKRNLQCEFNGMPCIVEYREDEGVPLCEQLLIDNRVHKLHRRINVASR
jgi:hypothetical protein